MDLEETKRRLRRALSALDDAARAVKNARVNAGDDSGYINRALREISDAEDDVLRALRELE